MVKPKILCISDSPSLDSGMGRGHRELVQRLHDTGRFSVASFGWFFQSAQQRGVKWEFPWRQFTNSRTDRPYGHPDNWPNPSQRDWENSAIYQVINEMFKPDVVIAMGDEWMVDYLYKIPIRDNFKLIHEVPIDGEPIPRQWARDFKTADVLISMSEYGKRVIQDADKNCNVTVLPRGIDTSVFTKINAPKEMLRKSYMPTAQGRFVVGVFNRFQDRKQIGRAVEAFAKFISDGKHKDCDLYLHLDMNDAFSVSQKKTLDGEFGLIERYGIRDRIIVNKDITVEKGVTSDVLNALYNCCNVYLSTTQGEGYGLTVAEALACGLPCIATNYTTIPELLGRDGSRGLLAKVQTYITGMYNIERALVDTDDVARLLEKLYRSPSLRKQIGDNARQHIQQTRWDTIIKQWEKLIDDCLRPIPYRLKSEKSIIVEDIKDINIYGAVFENTGFSITTQGISKGFKQLGWNTKITEGGGRTIGHEVDKDIHDLINAESSNNLAFINHIPEHAFKIASSCNARHKIIYFPFELDCMTSDIVGNINRLADVYCCPSSFCENIAKKSGVLNTAVIPLASDIDVSAEPATLKTKKKYKFLVLGNLGDKRKNVHFIIRAFMRSFTSNDDVCLVLKSMPGHQDSDPSELVETEKYGCENPPETEVIHSEDKDIAKYYAACDCLVMLSRCEGWGHPVFQALMFGMPIIASNYGGYLDFINKGKNVQLIDGVLQQANASPVFKANEKWFIPNFDDTVGAMKKAYTVNMRKTGENYVADYSWKKTAEAIEKVYNEKINKNKKVKVYYERMIKNLWNEDNEIGFKSYAPVNYEFVSDYNDAELQILDITRISDKHYLRCENYILLFHTFGEWANESPSKYYDLFKNAKFVYSHIDLAPLYPEIDKNKFMRGPWGCNPDIWFKQADFKNDLFQILCTGEIASTEGIEESIAVCDKLKTKMIHVGPNLQYKNHSYKSVSNLSHKDMREAYNNSLWVSGMRRIEGFEKPVCEGLLCGARPICFDTPLYRHWYGNLARYVKEGTQRETSDDIIRVMTDEYAVVTDDEKTEVRNRFGWKNVSKKFWEKVKQIGDYNAVA